MEVADSDINPYSELDSDITLSKTLQKKQV